jgi:hypothetical protein
MVSSMMKIEDNAAMDGPVGSEGERSPSALSIGQAPPSQPTIAPTTEAASSVAAPKVGPLAPGQRWSVARKREVVMRLLRSESVELLSRELAVPIFKLEQWHEKADAALDGALKEREADTASIELDAAMKPASSAWRSNCCARASRSPAIWSAGGRADGQGDLPHHRPAIRHRARLPALGRARLQLLCRASARATKRRAGAHTGAAQPEARDHRRGLLAAIKRDLETSPWTGEGHRKVWARLRVRDAREHAALAAPGSPQG